MKKDVLVCCTHAWPPHTAKWKNAHNWKHQPKNMTLNNCHERFHFCIRCAKLLVLLFFVRKLNVLSCKFWLLYVGDFTLSSLDQDMVFHIRIDDFGRDLAAIWIYKMLIRINNEQTNITNAWKINTYSIIWDFWRHMVFIPNIVSFNVFLLNAFCCSFCGPFPSIFLLEFRVRCVVYCLKSNEWIIHRRYQQCASVTHPSQLRWGPNIMTKHVEITQKVFDVLHYILWKYFKIDWY